MLIISSYLNKPNQRQIILQRRWAISPKFITKLSGGFDLVLGVRPKTQRFSTCLFLGLYKISISVTTRLDKPRFSSLVKSNFIILMALQRTHRENF